jgi:Family of unknown function (DUF6275)
MRPHDKGPRKFRLHRGRRKKMIVEFHQPVQPPYDMYAPGAFDAWIGHSVPLTAERFGAIGTIVIGAATVDADRKGVTFRGSIDFIGTENPFQFAAAEKISGLSFRVGEDYSLGPATLRRRDDEAFPSGPVDTQLCEPEPPSRLIVISDSGWEDADYHQSGPYMDGIAGAIAVRYQCTRCDFELVTPVSPELTPENEEMLRNHLEYHDIKKKEEDEMGVPIKTTEDFQSLARQAVFEYARSHLDVTDDNVAFTADNVYIVWFCYILGNWKALLSTELSDGMYYEVTYNFTRNEMYLDAYKKFENRIVTPAVPLF